MMDSIEFEKRTKKLNLNIETVKEIQRVRLSPSVKY